MIECWLDVMISYGFVTLCHSLHMDESGSYTSEMCFPGEIDEEPRDSGISSDPPKKKKNSWDLLGHLGPNKVIVACVRCPTADCW